MVFESRLARRCPAFVNDILSNDSQFVRTVTDDDYEILGYGASRRYEQPSESEPGSCASNLLARMEIVGQDLVHGQADLCQSGEAGEVHDIVNRNGQLEHDSSRPHSPTLHISGMLPLG